MPRPCCNRSRCGTTFQCINGEMENGYCSQHVLGYLFRNSDIDHRQIGACCACSKCGTFLFAPLMVIVLWPQYREKIAQHMLRAIAVLHFPIYALKSCPAPAAIAAGAGHYFSLTAYNLTFKPPYRGKGLKKDIS